jgi:hypothetical protein
MKVKERNNEVVGPKASFRFILNELREKDGGWVFWE